MQFVDDQRSDRDLLIGARSDPDAFALFYRRHVDMVLGYFYRRTADAETAADLTAETFAQALASIDRYQPTDAPASAWLVAIARNQLHYLLRKRRVRRGARARLGMRTDVDVGQREVEAVERLFDAALLVDDLDDAWQGLSDDVADAVRLRIVEDLPYRDVARQLGCSEGAARVRVARGLSRLAERMGGSW